MSLHPPDNSPIAAGYRLDRYELICPIAEGGMASVWIARQTGKHGFKKLVAVKTILPKYASDTRFQSMFIDEARIASRIEHENVTQILDVGEQHEVTYLVMEYVDGDSLSKVNRAAKKKGARIPLGVLLRMMADVSGGLHAAHELKDEAGVLLGVVHRDVSPQNVLVTMRGVAKLIDFGIAKARDRLAGDTSTDQIKGKVAYMAPEQALGRATVDRRADVWAVGAVLYHLIVGKPPYEAENDIQTLFMVSSGRPPVPLPPSEPPAVRAVVKKALSHAPEDRYATALELQAALEDAMVQSNLVTSTATVAQFLADTVGDRADKRKEAITVGLKAAEEREKFADMMQSNAERTTGSGTSDSTRTRTPASSAGMDRMSASQPTGQTLGSAAMDVPAGASSRGVKIAIVGGIAGACLGVAGLVAMFGGHKAAAPLSAAAQAPVATASAAPKVDVPGAASASASAEPAASEAAAPSASAESADGSHPPSAAAERSKRGAPAAPVWHPAARPAAAAAAATHPAATAPPAPTVKERENYGF